MLNLIRLIVGLLTEIRDLLKGEEYTNLEKEYREFKFFADSRGLKMLEKAGLLDEYNDFMNDCEEELFGDDRKIVLPKPSPELKAFKDRFNRIF